MKICKRLLCGSLTLFGLLITSRSNGQQPGDGYFQPAGVQPMMADVNVGWPGRVWVEASLADQGLGYNGSYFTIGAKTHISQDFLDGRWMVEARGHYDPENEGFFGNVGLERVFSLPSAGADVSAGFWYDYDSDLQGDFSHAMNALGVSGSIKTHRWAMIGNGYFPIGTADYSEGDPTGVNCFLNNSIVTQAGIDSALKGFDALLQYKPEAVAHINGSIGIGGYGYSSELVQSFGGVRARVGMQFNQGMIVNAEINHDNRFDITGVVQLGWLFGAGARGTEYGFLGTDLEPTIRNDHIVRFQQDLRLAIDPDTGRPYDVYHVDNTADPGIQDGRAQSPFTTLAAAEAASSADDIIFVREGDRTTRNMENGIVLKDGQLLLGDGVRHIIPLLGGTNFVLCNDLDGIRPTITNTAGNAVTLANRNTVRGIVMDGTAGGMINGIRGAGTLANPLTTGIIEDVTITGTPVLNGISLLNVAGNWRFDRNDIQTAAFDGILIDNALDATSTFDFGSNNVSNNGGHGIHMLNYDGTRFNFVNNTTSGNVGNGVFLENYTNSLGTGATLDFINPVAFANQDNGISLDDFTGNVRILNSNIQNNLNGGISLVDVVTPGPLEMVFIGTSGGGVSNILGNGVGTGAGVFNQLNIAGAREHLVVTNSTINNGGMGVSSSATDIGANLQTDIVDNLSISGNQADGIRLMSSGGATHTAQVINTAAAGTLQMNNNQGSGISQFASGIGPVSLLETDIQNVNIGNSGDHGMLLNSSDDGQIISRSLNTTIAGAGQDGVQINADNLNSFAVNEFRFENVSVTNVTDDGMDINIGDQTFADFSLVNSILNNVDAAGNPTGNQGLEVNATGDVAATIDTRLRLNVVGTTINAFDSGDGVDITSAGDAHVFAQIEANVITNNGNNQVAIAVPTLPFGDGINILATGNSEIFTRIQNNQITLNAEQGLDIDTVGNGRVTALVTGNFIASNDTQDDAATIPNEANNFDMLVDNGVTGRICIAMSSNFFNLPVLFTNVPAGALAFRVELDGLTNGLGVPNFVGLFTLGPFSTVCSPAIDAEDLAFQLDGFTPLP